jgi:hypothetical protein
MIEPGGAKSQRLLPKRLELTDRLQQEAIGIGFRDSTSALGDGE